MFTRVAATASRNTVIPCCTSPTNDGYEVFKSIKRTMTTIGARPIEIIQGFEPLGNTDFPAVPLAGGASNLRQNTPMFRLYLRSLGAFIANTIGSVIFEDIRLLTDHTRSFGVSNGFVGAFWMEVSSIELDNHIFGKKSHSIFVIPSPAPGAHSLFLKLLLFCNALSFPFYYLLLCWKFERIHVDSKKKSPFMSPARVTQRGGFDCISDLLACPSKSVRSDYTMKLEQVC
jgi:hypothetical protein